MKKFEKICWTYFAVGPLQLDAPRQNAALNPWLMSLLLLFITEFFVDYAVPTSENNNETI